MAGELGMGDERWYSFDQPIPQGGDPPVVLRAPLLGQLQGGGRPHDAGHVLRPRSTIALVGAARLDGQETEPPAGVEDAHPLGPVELMGREGEKIHVEGIDIQIEGTSRLDCVRVEGDPPLPGDPPDLGDGLDRPHLVVGVHDGDEGGPVGDGPSHVVGIHAAVRVHGQVGHLETEALLQLVAGVEDSVVLDGRGDDVVALVALAKGDAPEGQVIALRATTGEDNFPLFCSQDLGHRRPGLVQGLERLAAQAVDA